MINERSSPDRGGTSSPEKVAGEDSEHVRHHLNETWLTSTMQGEDAIPASLRMLLRWRIHLLGWPASPALLFAH
jgi:hypothetical protein